MKYTVSGRETGEWVVILHGWGATKEAMMPIGRGLENDWRVFIPDMYGFGETPHPPRALTVEDYAEGVEKIAMLENVTEAVVIGHSFGGRVAVKLAARGKLKVKRLVLIDAAGLKPRGAFFRAIRVKVHKILKKLGGRGLKGSADFEALEGYKKFTFINVVNEYLTGDARKINTGALLIWGALDRDTPPYMGRRYRRLISGSVLYVLRGAGHFSYADKPEETLSLIRAYIA